jgi:hypothetical protein
MKKKIANSLCLIAIGFIIALLVLDKPKEVTEKSVEVIRQTVDTVYIEREPEVIRITKTVPLPYKVYQYVGINDTIQLPLSAAKYKKNYKDTLEVSPQFKLTYDLVTTGDLDSIYLGYIDTRATMMLMQKSTVVKPNRGLYVGVSTDVTAGLLYQFNRNVIALDTRLGKGNIKDPSNYRLSYYRKLF